MTTPVKFTIANLLKEKGFSTPTSDLYIDDELIYADGRICNWNLEPEYEELENPISAPTIAEVVMWLYEKYGIWVFVSKTIHSQKWYYTHQINDEREGSWNDYNSLTEAYEAVILHCLTNFM